MVRLRDIGLTWLKKKKKKDPISRLIFVILIEEYREFLVDIKAYLSIWNKIRKLYMYNVELWIFILGEKYWINIKRKYYVYSESMKFTLTSIVVRIFIYDSTLWAFKSRISRILLHSTMHNPNNFLSAPFIGTEMHHYSNHARIHHSNLNNRRSN